MPIELREILQVIAEQGLYIQQLQSRITQLEQQQMEKENVPPQAKVPTNGDKVKAS